MGVDPVGSRVGVAASRYDCVLTKRELCNGILFVFDVGGIGFLSFAYLSLDIRAPAEVCLTDLAWDYPGV